MESVFKFEAQNFNMEYTLDNLDFFSRGLYDLIRKKIEPNKTFTALAIARYSTEKLCDIENGLNILTAFGFITKTH